MADIEKQSYEEFRIDVDFGLNMTSPEALTLESCTVICIDKNNEDVSATLLDNATKALVTGSESELAEAGLQILIKAGSEALSLYKFTFKGVTNLSPPNKWEKDITLKIKEK